MELFKNFCEKFFTLFFVFLDFTFGNNQNIVNKFSACLDESPAFLFGHHGSIALNCLDVLFTGRDNIFEKFLFMSLTPLFVFFLIPIGVRNIPLSFAIAHVLIGKLNNIHNRAVLTLVLNESILDCRLVFTEFFIRVINGNVKVDEAVVLGLIEDVGIHRVITLLQVVDSIRNEVGCVEDEEARFYVEGESSGFTSMEGYIIDKELLVKMMDECAAKNLYRFHRDAIAAYLAGGGKMDVYVHEGYYQPIRSVDLYYQANRDMLEAEKRHDLFCAERPIRTRHSSLVSAYYGEKAVSKNSLIGDNCRILGTVENCVLSSEVVVEEGAVLRDCVVMRRTTIGKGALLENVIVDKDCRISAGTALKGNEKLPLVVPKGSRI